VAIGDQDACDDEMNEIYSDDDFLKVVGDIMEKCPTQMETTETSASITADYSNCAASDAFEPACTAATGLTIELPHIYISCAYTDDEGTYTGTIDINGMGMCVGSSCTAEEEAPYEEKSEEDMEKEIEAALEEELAKIGITGGEMDCDVSRSEFVRVSKDKKYDGWTKDEIKDECDNPKNCNACKRDCPSKYKKGCKEYKGCGDTDEEALAFA